MENEKIDRITFNHILNNLLVILSVERGIFFTLKGLFIKPGFTIYQYLFTIERNRYSKPFRSALILIAILSFGLAVTGITKSFTEGIISGFNESAIDGESEIFTQVLVFLLLEYPTVLYLLWIPINGLLCSWLFRKSNLYLSEHFIVNAFLLVGQSSLGIIGVLFAHIIGEGIILVFLILGIVFQFYLFFSFYQRKMEEIRVFIKTTFSFIIGLLLYLLLSVVIGGLVALIMDLTA